MTDNKNIWLTAGSPHVPSDNIQPKEDHVTMFLLFCCFIVKDLNFVFDVTEAQITRDAVS